MDSTLSLDMRPSTFDEIIGLEDIVTAMKNKLGQGVPRAIMLAGPYGCGKTTLAWLIAKFIQGWDFDGQPQAQEINGANYRKIDDMRKLAEGCGAYPMVGKYGVIIMDEAQQLTKDAQQILLKELEVRISPTVWIICTTDPEKINSGVRDRCSTFSVRGMDAEKRAVLIARAAAQPEHTGDTADFAAAVTKGKMTSPRKILQAFELYHNGISAQDAVQTMQFAAAPEYFDICMGVVFGQWSKGFILPWIVDKETGKPKPFKSVAEQLKALDDKLKKKPAADTQAAPDADSDADPVEEEDAQGRPEVARALRAITAASLKNQIYKGGAKAQRAAKALEKLAHCTAFADPSMEFAAMIGGLFSVNIIMQGQ